MGHTDLNVVCEWAQLGNRGLYPSQTDRGWRQDPGCAAGVGECGSGHLTTVLEVGLMELGEREPLTPRGLGWGTDLPMGKREPLFQAVHHQTTSTSRAVLSTMLLVSFHTFSFF